jgi:anti-sigma factor RsiW
MNHLDEISCLLYLEGQLEPARSRELAQHTAECDQCRKLLHALQHESLALSRALVEADEPVPTRLLSPEWHPAWRVPSWIWVAACGLFAAGAAWTWTDTISPWLDQLANAGFGAVDFISMFFFNAAFWEGWSDMFEFLQIAALALVAVVAFRMLRRRVRRPAAVALIMSAALLAIASPQSASAAEVRRGNTILIPSSETVHNDLIVAGQSVRMEGTVEGDLIAFSRNLVVTGHVTGDVIAFGGEIRIEGVVDGNVRVGSNTLTISGSVGKNMTELANTLELAAKGQIGGGVISLNQNLNLDGTLRRDLLGLAGNGYLEGMIGGNVRLRGNTLTVAPTANIGGSSTFEGPNQPTVAAGAKFASPLHVEIMPAVRRNRQSVTRQIFQRILSYAAALLMSLILVALFPGFFRSTMREVNRIGLPIGMGALAIVCGFFLALMAILLVFVGVGAGIAAVLLYGPIFYLSQIFVGAWLGNKILGEPIGVNGVIVGRIALGLLILDVVRFIPILGGLVELTVILWGTGAVLMGFYRLSRTEPPPTVQPA